MPLVKSVPNKIITTSNQKITVISYLYMYVVLNSYGGYKKDTVFVWDVCISVNYMDT